MEQGEIIRALSRSPAYAELGIPGVDHVEVIHTHASVVFLVGDHVFKLKKSVNFGFLDYSTPTKRKAMCEAEVRLNRRLAPDVYLGVVPVSMWCGDVRIGSSQGEIIEYAVHMRRLADGASLANMLARHAVSEQHVRDIASRIARFHRTSARSSPIASYGRFDVVVAHCRDNFAGMELLRLWSPELMDMLERRTDATLQQQRTLIETRAQRGMPCEIHGDLRCDHVYVLPTNDGIHDVRIIDCIEFSDALRHGDPVADFSFLYMDIMSLGHWELAHKLADAYFDVADDVEGRALLPLYSAYRATVRAKVDVLVSHESEVSNTQRERAWSRARGHALLAVGELAPACERPCVVLVAGLPGTGKSTLTHGLVDASGFTWIRSDVLRKRLAGLSDRASVPVQPNEGIYTPEHSNATYEACLHEAELALRRGKRALVDASFVFAKYRRWFFELARRYCVRFVMLVCAAPEALVRARLKQRRDDVSDADERIYSLLLSQWQAHEPELGRLTHDVDTSASPELARTLALARLREHGVM